MSGSARSCGKRRIEDLTIAVLVRSESTADIRDTVSETGVNPEKVFFFNTSKKLLEYAATTPCDVALIAADKLSAKFLDRLCKVLPGVVVASIGAAETLGFRQVIDRGHRFKILNADNLGAALSDFLSSLCQECTISRGRYLYARYWH